MSNPVNRTLRGAYCLTESMTQDFQNLSFSVSRICTMLTGCISGECILYNVSLLGMHVNMSLSGEG